MNLLAAISLTLVLAFLTESMVEYFLGLIIDKVPKLDPFRWLLSYISAVVAILLAFHYQIDLIAWLATEAGAELATSWVGIVMTGLVIGRGANYAHQFVSKWFPSK